MEEKHSHNCSCGHSHEHHDIPEEDLYCDIDPSKICDNCCQCLDQFNTDEQGYVQIKVDKIDTSKNTLQDFYKMYGIDDEDDE